MRIRPPPAGGSPPPGSGITSCDADSRRICCNSRIVSSIACWAPVANPSIASAKVCAPSISKLIGRVPIGVITEIWPM